MNVLVINGSPRLAASNTMKLTNAFISAAPQDAVIKTVQIYKKNIQPCRGCFSCWGKTAGSCIINDDMRDILTDMLWADIIIESFPLYFFGMPSGLKAMTDRTLPLMKPYMGDIGVGSAAFHDYRDSSMNSKKVVIISTCGYVQSEPMYPSLLKQLDLIWGEDNYTSILCPEGEIFISDNAKRQRHGYLSLIKKAGEEYFESFSISDKTQNELKKPILSPKGFEALTLAHRNSTVK